MPKVLYPTSHTDILKLVLPLLEEVEHGPACQVWGARDAFSRIKPKCDCCWPKLIRHIKRELKPKRKAKLVARLEVSELHLT